MESGWLAFEVATVAWTIQLETTARSFVPWNLKVVPLVPAGISHPPPSIPFAQIVFIPPLKPDSKMKLNVTNSFPVSSGPRLINISPLAVCALLLTGSPDRVKDFMVVVWALARAAKHINKEGRTILRGSPRAEPFTTIILAPLDLTRQT